MSSLLPPVTFGRKENSIGEVKDQRLCITGLLLLPLKEPWGPAPLLPRDDVDEVEAENDNARTPPDPEDEGRGPNTLLQDLRRKPSLLPQ
jgi:hypothetical protein